MVVYFRNNCGCPIYISISDIWNGIIKPNKTIQIVCDEANDLTFSINIYDKKIVKGNIYNLNLLSQFTFKNIEDNANFIITREKIRVSLYVTYERLFVEASKATKHMEKTVVKDEERIKKRYKRDRLVELLYGPLTHFPMLTIILFVGGILITFLFNWYLAIVYFPLIYLSLFGLHWLVDAFWKCVEKKAFKMDDETDFYQYFEPTYISNYYSQTNREPFMGKIDRK